MSNGKKLFHHENIQNLSLLDSVFVLLWENFSKEHIVLKFDKGVKNYPGPQTACGYNLSSLLAVAILTLNSSRLTFPGFLNLF